MLTSKFFLDLIDIVPNDYSETQILWINDNKKVTVVFNDDEHLVTLFFNNREIINWELTKDNVDLSVNLIHKFFKMRKKYDRYSARLQIY